MITATENLTRAGAPSGSPTGSPFPGSTKCARPKMLDHGGATWDRHKIIDAKCGEHTGYLDTSWGQYFYFPHDGQWRKARIDRFMTGSDNTVIFSSANAEGETRADNAAPLSPATL